MKSEVEEGKLVFVPLGNKVEGSEVCLRRYILNLVF